MKLKKFSRYRYLKKSSYYNFYPLDLVWIWIHMEIFADLDPDADPQHWLGTGTG